MLAEREKHCHNYKTDRLLLVCVQVHNYTKGRTSGTNNNNKQTNKQKTNPTAPLNATTPASSSLSHYTSRTGTHPTCHNPPRPLQCSPICDRNPHQWVTRSTICPTRPHPHRTDFRYDMRRENKTMGPGRQVKGES